MEKSTGLFFPTLLLQNYQSMQRVPTLLNVNWKNMEFPRVNQHLHRVVPDYIFCWFGAGRTSPPASVVPMLSFSDES